ncbi:MAG: hypothetical protein JSV96_01720 [Candidatus Aminicenantes bacterium]|nr:MAG: hypothetical protein JSV96_01720 [Candidatus Aminicenantes bacterium]
MKKFSLLLLILSFLFLPGSSFEERNDEFKIIKEDGIPVALNPAYPVPLKKSPKDIIFNDELTLGQVEGDPNYVFSEFISYTVDDKENMYVLDWRAKTIRKFDKNGKYLLSFGGEGQGPGEFTFPEEIRLLSNGHLMVFEGEAQRYSFFTQEGKFVKSGRFLKLMSPPFFGFSSGNFIATNIQRESKRTVVITGLFDAKSELLTSLHEREMEPYKPWPSQDDVSARARRIAERFSRIAFRPSVTLTVDSKEKIHFAFTDKFEIKVYSSDGLLKKILRTELPMLPVEKKDREGYISYWLPRDLTTWNSMSKQFQNKIKSLIRFPDKKPAFLSIIPMDSDYMMVVRDRSFKRDSLIDIFDSSGRFIIEKKLNFNIKSGLCRKGKLYTIHEDEDGNQYVKRFRYALSRKEH